MRDPPLATTTVVNYILEAIRLEKLPFERERLREVMVLMPVDVLESRYRSVWKLVK